MAGFLNSLGIKLRIQFNQTEKMGDLEEAIEKIEQVIKIALEDHPALPGQLNNRVRYLSLSSEPHRGHALGSFLQSWRCHNEISYLRARLVSLSYSDASGRSPGRGCCIAFSR